MRIALCLYGYPSSDDKTTVRYSQSEEILNLSYQNYSQRFTNFIDLDIFIHTWDSGISNEYIKLFKPKDFKVEPFVNQYSKLQHFMGFSEKASKYFQSFIGRNLTIKKAVDLCRNHELKNSFLYDLIVLTRPDLYWLIDLDFSTFDPNRILITNNVKYMINNHKHVTRDEFLANPNVLKNTNLIDCSYPAQNLFDDVMFVSNSNYIYIISKLFDFMLSYFINGTDHHKSIFDHISSCNLLHTVTKKFDRWKDYYLTRELVKIRHLTGLSDEQLSRLQ